MRLTTLSLLLVVATSAIQDVDAFLDAARAGDAARVRSFIASGIDVNATNDEGRTVLMEAASRNEREIVEILLRYGADATARESPEELLDEAIRAGDEDAIARTSV